MRDETATWSYRPGPWYAVFGPAVTVLLPGSHAGIAGELWPRVQAGADFEEVLDAVLVVGLRGLSTFAIVEADGDTVRALVRGEGIGVTVETTEGAVTFDGPADQVWSERVVRGVVSLTVTVPGEPAGPSDAAAEREIGTGLVPVGRVDHPSRGSTTAERPDASAAPVVVPIAGPDVVTDVVPNVVPDAVPDVVPEVAPDVVPDVVPDLGPDTAPVAARAEPRAVGRLRTSDGQQALIDRVVLIGRAPRRRNDAEEDAVLVAVPSPLKEISSTHVEVRPGTGADEGFAVVTDMGSTNGTVMTPPGEGPQDLRPGIAARVEPGTRIDLGDGVDVEVDPA